MLDERPDNAATAETMRTTKLFILGVKTWYGFSLLLSVRVLLPIWLDSSALPTAGVEASWMSRSSEGLLSLDGRLGASLWVCLLDEATGDRGKVCNLIQGIMYEVWSQDEGRP
jgi:hypothetical protein